MLRLRFLVAFGLLACLAGCASKPPAEVLGVWQRIDADPFSRVTQRLKLTEKGNFRVTHQVVTAGNNRGSTAIADTSPLTGGPVDKDGFETLQRGTFQVKDGQIIFTTIHAWIAGVDVGPTLTDRVSKSRFSVSGNTMQIETKGLMMHNVEPSPLAAATQPAPQATAIVLTRTQ